MSQPAVQFALGPVAAPGHGVAAHWLPCAIETNGPNPISTFFLPKPCGDEKRSELRAAFSSCAPPPPPPAAAPALHEPASGPARGGGSEASPAAAPPTPEEASAPPPGEAPGDAAAPSPFSPSAESLQLQPRPGGAAAASLLGEDPVLLAAAFRGRALRGAEVDLTGLGYQGEKPGPGI